MTSYPPAFGPYEWFTLHAMAAGQEEVGDAFSEAKRRELDAFFRYKAGKLMCGGCSWHFSQYVREHPPGELRDGAAFWRYLVDFHNAVNDRTGKRVVSDEEAREMLREQLAKVPVLDACTETQWVALSFMCFTFAANAAAARPDERGPFLEHVSSWLRWAPFTQRRAELLSRLEARVERDRAAEWATEGDGAYGRKQAIALISDLANLAGREFGRVERTTEEFTAEVFGRFSRTKLLEIARAEQLRKEDHNKITQLEVELRLLRGDKSPLTPSEMRALADKGPNGEEALPREAEGGCASSNAWIAITAILATLLVLVGLALVLQPRFRTAARFPWLKVSWG